MPSEPAPADESPFDVSEDEVDKVLAICDGDPRAAIRVLLIGQAHLEHELSQRASRGFSRGRSLPLAKLSEVQG